MTRKADEIILSRLIRELGEVDSVALGEGLPQMAGDLLSGVSKIVSMDRETTGPVEVAVVEAREVSGQGDLVLSGASVNGLQARKWIVATPHTADDGTPKLVRECRFPVDRERCVGLVITELGVIEINSIGLVLKELAPGVSSDDVKMRTAASLHVADDVTLMEL